jgi:RHS repeat-associated protein
MRTYQSLAHGTEPTAETAGAATTTWTYSPTRGFLTRKEYADTTGTDYTYTAAGRLATRTWARGVVTTYTYAAGQLVHTNYSDTTPDVTVAYDSFGRQTNVTNGVATTTYVYDGTTLALDTETISYDLNAASTPDFTRVIDRSQDTLERDNGWQLKNGATIENEVIYAYDITGRLGSATSPAGTFSYAYQANSMGLLHTVTGPAHTVTNTWDATRDVLTEKENKVGTTVVSAYEYSVNPLGQRTEVAKTGSAFASNRSVAWGYDALGQVTKADSSITGFDRAYEFDGVGNRKKAADSLTLPSTDNYTANALNQYTAVDAVNPAYDDDGNATAYPVPAHLSANSVLGWDAENRLISATVNGTTTTYHYDSGSRRVFQTTGSATTVYVYDAWNPIAEYTGTTLAKTYTWGMDLSGSLQGAGGVGGLLAVTDEVASGTPSYFPTFDGNGNVSEYLDGIGAVVAHYEYDPFGRTTVTFGAKAADFDHRFSTKPLDRATGLIYYGYRYLDPVTGRWPSRDPLEEDGGINLYAFVFNGAINDFDVLGQNAGMALARMLLDAGITAEDVYHFFAGNARTWEVSFGIPIGPLRGTDFTGALTTHNKDPQTCCVAFEVAIGATWDVKKILPLPKSILKKIPNALSVSVFLEGGGQICPNKIYFESVGLHGSLNFGETRRGRGGVRTNGLAAGGFVEVEGTWFWRKRSFEANYTIGIGWSVNYGRLAHNWDWEHSGHMLGSPWSY